MKKILILIAIIASIITGCTNIPLEHKMNDAYHRGYCDGRLSEIQYYRTNNLFEIPKNSILLPDLIH